MRVLLTGAAGSIGQVAVPGLRALGHEVVGLDLPGRAPGSVVVEVEGDCADPVAVDRVVGRTRPDAVVHLAGNPDESALPDALESHVLTTAALLEAAVRHGVPRFVHASSNHAVGRTPRGDVGGGAVLSTEVRGRPDTFYGVAKVAAEALLQLYADRHGLDVVALRIGSFGPQPTSRRQLATWLSPADAVRLLHAALEAAAPAYAVVHGVSANTRGWWDPAPGHALRLPPPGRRRGLGGRDRGAAGHRPGRRGGALRRRPARDCGAGATRLRPGAAPGRPRLSGRAPTPVPLPRRAGVQ